ncbi:peroxisomal sarcosine oxidase-like [Ischnura elegans]|uniref:peroxisomal sarcosine oxidase-like n=1 Tax=Ischnura elegans TaxID=197161 RepID=UPI001ED88C27|nr:peroxisomal sarcosine oxidase-like [Ischnura elegans]
MSPKYDHIVIGAGIEGSWTAYHLAKLGQKVLLLEQFNLPHTRGSSHGQTRITRYGYVEDFHAALMEEAYRKWSELEKEAAETLFVETGTLYLAGKKDYGDLDSIISNLSNIPNASHSKLTSDELKKKYPQFCFPKDYLACYEKNGGVLLASRCLNAVQQRFKSVGGRLIDGFEVLRINPGPPAVVYGSKTWKDVKGIQVNHEESFTANSVIVCAGPWSGSFLKKTLGLNLPLTPQKIDVYYWRVKDLSLGGLPVAFIDLRNNGEFYGLPSLEYPDMVKLVSHHQEDAEPNKRDVSRRAKDRDIKKYVREHFPTIEPIPSIVETCMYTNTPDEVCILDKHPFYNNIVFGCGFSGTGFKISPVVGHILGNLAMGKPPVHNIKPFALQRFMKPGAVAKL